MNTNWLPGGPYFEVSILTSNQQSRECLINSCIQKLDTLQNKIELVEHRSDIENKINSFVEQNSDSIDFNVWVTVAGKRRARLFIAILSDEIVLIDFWFLGDEFSKQPITKNEQPKFKKFLEEMLCVYGGFVGTLGWEADCISLLETKNPYPHKDYSIKNLKLNGEIPAGIENLINKMA